MLSVKKKTKHRKKRTVPLLLMNLESVECRFLLPFLVPLSLAFPVLTLDMFVHEFSACDSDTAPNCLTVCTTPHNESKSILVHERLAFLILRIAAQGRLACCKV